MNYIRSGHAFAQKRKSAGDIDDIHIGGGLMNTRGLGGHYAARAHVYGERLQYIRDRGGASLRLEVVHPDLLERGGSLRITAPLGTIPDSLFGYLETNGAIAQGRLDIGKLGELFDTRYAFRKREEGFYLRAGEEMTRETMMSAVIGRLVGSQALVPRYGALEGKVIDAVHTLYSTVQPADGFWHSPLEEWDKKKSMLDDHGVMIDLSGFDLYKLDFAGANLRNMNLTGAVLDRSDLSEADLSFSQVRYASANHVDFTGALLMGADFYRSSLMQADFENAVAHGARFNGAEIMMANFFRAMLIGAQFDGNWHLFEGDLRYNIESSSRHKINSRLGWFTCLASTPEGIRSLREMALQEYADMEVGWGRTPDQASRAAENHFRFKAPAELVEFLMKRYVDKMVDQEMLYSFQGVPISR